MWERRRSIMAFAAANSARSQEIKRSLSSEMDTVAGEVTEGAGTTAMVAGEAGTTADIVTL
jgi:hypothetical protein